MGEKLKMKDYNGDKAIDNTDTQLRIKHLMNQGLSSEDAEKKAQEELKNTQQFEETGVPVLGNQKQLKKLFKERDRLMLIAKKYPHGSAGIKLAEVQTKIQLAQGSNNERLKIQTKTHNDVIEIQIPKTKEWYHLQWARKNLPLGDSRINQAIGAYNKSVKKPFHISAEIGVSSGGDTHYQGEKIHSDVSPYYKWGLRAIYNEPTEQALADKYSKIFPKVSNSFKLSKIREVHGKTYDIIRTSNPGDVQKNLINEFKNASGFEKLLLANTLGDVIERYTYNETIFDGKGVESSTSEVFGALQQAVLTGRQVNGGVCTDIHIAVSQTLSALGIESGVVSVGQNPVAHAVSMIKIDGQYIISDYGKMYTGRNRDEVFEAYEKENGLPSTIHYIADKNGNIIGYMRTALGKKLKQTIAGQDFENYMKTGQLPQGVSVHLKNGKKGIDIRKELGKRLYIGGKMGEDTINGQTITYKMGTIGINNVNKTINAEINIGETEIDFGNGENSTDVHINAKIQARKEFRLTGNTTVKLAGGVEGTLSFNKNNVRTVTIDNPVYNSITNPNVPRTITKKLPITPNNGEIFAFLGGEVIKVHQSGTTYTLGAVVEYTTVANLNKFDSQASIMNDGLKMGNARSKIYGGVEKKIRHGTVDASVLLTSDNLGNTLGINGQWKPNNKRFDIAVHTSVTQGNGFNGHVDSTTTGISAGLNYPNNTRFTGYLNHTNTEGVGGDTVIGVGVKHTF